MKGKPLEADGPDPQCDLDTTVPIYTMRGIHPVCFEAANFD